MAKDPLEKTPDLRGHRHLALRRTRMRRWYAGATLLSVASLGWWLLGDARPYQAGPVSSAHELWAKDCRVCHKESWQPWQRLTGHPTALSTPNSACLACHNGATHYDPDEIALDCQLREALIEGRTEKWGARPLPEIADRPSCAQCHREHRGRASLADVEDLDCLACHENLQKHDGKHHTGTFANEITEFRPGKHPEFAIRRSPTAVSQADRHGVMCVAKPAGVLWTDKAVIEFNHAVHLVSKGLPQNDKTKRETLDCAACHARDDDGRSMRPIEFEQHCQRCHAEQFQFEDQFTQGALQPLPHLKAAEVRDILKSRILNHVIGNRGDAQQPERSAEAQVLSAIRGETPPPGAILTAAEKSQFDGLYDRGTRYLFQTGPKGGDGKQRHGCAYCHVVDGTPEEPVVQLPQIPQRWFAHARFSHEAHREQNCSECHSQVLGSTATEDVHLPAIANCFQCHEEGRGSKPRADHRCVTCHDYHQHEWDAIEERGLKRDVLPAGLRSPTAASAILGSQPRSQAGER